MLSLGTHTIFFNFAEHSEYSIYIPETILSSLEDDLNLVSNFKEIVDDPYIVFNLDDTSEIYLYKIEKDIKCFFKNLVVSIHNFGLDFILTLDDNTNIIFPIFEIKKKKSFVLKNLFTSKEQKNNNISTKNITINYNATLDFFIDTERFEKCSFSLILEKELSIELRKFYKSYQTIWENFSLKKYPNLIIYFNKDNVEDGILFNITNCFVDLFILNCIQNRLFFITNIKDRPLLFINDLYFTTSKNKKLFFVNIDTKEASFNKEENCLKFNKILLKNILKD